MRGKKEAKGLPRWLLMAIAWGWLVLFFWLGLGCASRAPELPPDPVLCPVQDVPSPSGFVEPETDDLRELPEVHAANRERAKVYEAVIEAYNDARSRCG